MMVVEENSRGGGGGGGGGGGNGGDQRLRGHEGHFGACFREGLEHPEECHVLLFPKVQVCRKPGIQSVRKRQYKILSQ